MDSGHESPQFHRIVRVEDEGARRRIERLWGADLKPEWLQSSETFSPVNLVEDMSDKMRIRN